MRSLPEKACWHQALLLFSSRGPQLYPLCWLSQTLTTFPSVSSGCFINATKSVLFHPIPEKEQDPRSSKSEFQALSLSHTFLNCRMGLVLAYCLFLCHHILLGALTANLVLQCLPYQFFIPPAPDTIFFAQWMVERRLGRSSSEKEKENTCESTRDSPQAEADTGSPCPGVCHLGAEYFQIRQGPPPRGPLRHPDNGC